MRLLYLAHRLPYPPNKGEKIRSHGQLRALVAAGHEVHLLSLVDDRSDLDAAGPLRGMVGSLELVPLRRASSAARAVAALPGGRPLSVACFDFPDARRRAAALAASTAPETVVVDTGLMAQHLPAGLESRTVLDLVDVDSAKWSLFAEHVGWPLSSLYALEARRMVAYERALLGRFPATFVSTAGEAAYLRRLVPEPLQDRIEVLAAMPPLDAGWLPSAPSPAELVESPNPCELLFVGTLSYLPNSDAACFLVDELLPRVRAALPGTRLALVGRDPSRAVRRRAGRPGVHLIGPVADTGPYLRSSQVFVAPLRLAPGVQTKLLEALAAGCAVVTTPQAAVGLPVTAGEHLLVGSDADQLAALTIELLRVPERRQRLGLEARRLVARELSDPVTVHRPLLDRLEQLASFSKGQSIAGRAS